MISKLQVRHALYYILFTYSAKKQQQQKKQKQKNNMKFPNLRF